MIRRLIPTTYKSHNSLLHVTKQSQHNLFVRTIHHGLMDVENDTIFHLSSGFTNPYASSQHSHDSVGVAVVRISGPNALSALDHLSGPKGKHSSKFIPRTATLTSLYHPETKRKIDTQVLSLVFPGPKSFTGEDIVELHIHGNRLIVSELFDVLDKIEGFRIADSGEFTRRAFHNGKLDLTQIEGLADLLSAQTEQQKIAALHQVDGHLGILYEEWRQELLSSLAHLEAIVDFGDDEVDVEEDIIMNTVVPKLKSIANQLDLHLNDGRRGELIRQGIRIAIVGPTNAGKSTLLNALARRDIAIVSDIPGTTRDSIEATLDLSGYPVIMTDTAGIRSTNDEIEQEGIKRSRLKQKDAHISIVMLDSCIFLNHNNPIMLISEFIHNDNNQNDDNKNDNIDEKICVVLSKSDLLKDNELELLKDRMNKYSNLYSFVIASCEKKDGLIELTKKLDIMVQGSMIHASKDYNDTCITRERHRSHLIQCKEHLEIFFDLVENNHYDVVRRIESIRQATRSLGQITGRVDVEKLLDILFRDFCIGK